MRQAFAHEAKVGMATDGDSRAPGAAITVALCGRWDHEPPCPLSPHHTQADRIGSGAPYGRCSPRPISRPPLPPREIVELEGIDKKIKTRRRLAVCEIDFEGTMPLVERFGLVF